VAEDVEGVDEAVRRLARVELKARLDERADLQVVDVRRPQEYAVGHVPTAENATLAHLAEEAPRFDRGRPTAVVCASGYRSSIGTSLLERAGFREIYNVVGGTSGWRSAGFAVEEPAEARG
jgi:hydroxyacylglutathione hydrolase